MHDTLHKAAPGARHLADASQWLLELQDHPERFDAFDIWLHSDAAHFEAWAQVNRAWSALGEQPATTVEQWPQPAAPVALPVRRTRFALRHLLAAACVATIAFGATFLSSPVWRADYSTATAQTQVVLLADGSQLTLAPQSAINVTLQDNLRRVKLLKGEVFFEVAHDPKKPFEVQSQATVVRVLGTAFDVAQSSEGLKVEVRNGAVGVQAKGQPYRLAAGQRLWVPAEGAASQTLVATSEVAGWIDGVQFFENASVAQVVEQLQRYQRGWIIISDKALAKRHVTGLYDMRDTQRALQALVAPMGAEVRRYSPLLTVIGSAERSAEK